MNQKQKGLAPIAIIGLVVLVLVTVGGTSYYLMSKNKQVACTLEAMVCPDGSSVGRTGPKCEFAACPPPKDETADWKIYKNEEYGYEIKYPTNYLLSDGSKNHSIILISPWEFIEPMFQGKIGLSITILETTPFLNIESWKKKSSGNFWASEEELIINGKKALLVKGYNGDGNDRVVIFDSNKTYEIGCRYNYLISREESPNKEFLKTFDQIISTFKFVSTSSNGSNNKQMTDDEAKVFFKATEIVSNNLPDSIEFWTEAACPLYSVWAYIIPTDYELLMQNSNCITDTSKGVHGGCPTCVMSKIKLAEKSYQRTKNPSLQTIISSDQILLKSVPFNASPTEFINVYSNCNKPYLESCFGNGLVLTKYNSNDQSSIIAGKIDWVSGGNSGGLFIPIGLTKDNKKIVLSATMGSPGAGGGGIDYGYAMISLPSGNQSYEIIDNKNDGRYSNFIATRSSLFYDTYSKVVYVDEGENSPHFSQPGPENNGKIVYGDLISDTHKTLLEEEYTSYKIIKVFESLSVLEFEATKYTIPSGCSAIELFEFGYGNWIDLIPDCVVRTITTRTIELPI